MTIELDTPSIPAAHALSGFLDGRVHLPGDPGYDAARVAWNFAIDQRPAAVAFPRTAAEVSTVVRLDRERRQRYGAGQLIDILLGRETERVVQQPLA